VPARRPRTTRTTARAPAIVGPTAGLSTRQRLEPELRSEKLASPAQDPASREAGGPYMTPLATAHQVRRASPPIFAFPSPRPLLRGLTKEIDTLPNPTNPNPLTAGPSERSGADFFGAIPVASALGTAPGATPPRQLQLTWVILPTHPNPELSTLLEIGTFYFALTAQDSGRSHQLSVPEPHPNAL
jgi:hypothetical protein